MRDVLAEWLRSLCMRRDDGSWLVRVPATNVPAPQFYELSDDAGHAAYLEGATRMARLDTWISVGLRPIVAINAAMILHDQLDVSLWLLALAALASCVAFFGSPG